MSEKLNKASEFDGFEDVNGLSLEDHLAIEGYIPQKVLDAYYIEYLKFLLDNKSNISDAVKFAQINFERNRKLTTELDIKLKQIRIS